MNSRLSAVQHAVAGALLTVVMLGTACPAGPSPGQQVDGDVVSLDSVADHAAMVAAPGQGQPDGVQVILTASAWLNRMPSTGVGTGGRGLACTLTLSADAGIPAALEVNKVYIIHGDQVWIPDNVAEDRSLASRVVVSAREGPSWESPPSLDVVTRLEEADGGAWWLGVHGLEIEAVQ